MSGLAERLRADLTAAMRRRDRAAVSTLRSVLSTIANAEAVPVADAPVADASAATEGPVAGAVVGLGAAEAPRRELSEDDVRALVAGDRDDLLAAAAVVAPERAEELRAAADLLATYL